MKVQKVPPCRNLKQTMNSLELNETHFLNILSEPVIGHVTSSAKIAQQIFLKILF